MEDQEVMVGMRDVGCVSSSNEETVQQVSSGKESENLNVDLLEDLDSYWDDINDRLMISRMVSNSVIKGMVKAVEQAAEEKIAAKELQVDSLQEKLHSFRLGADKSESSLGLPLAVEQANKDAQLKISDLTRKYLDENENRVSLELRALQREEELRLVIEENKRLEQDVHLLVGSLEKKEKARTELSVALVKEKEKFQLASQKVNNLEDQRSLLQNLVTERSMEVDSIKGKLALILEKIEVDQGEINKLDQKVELMTKELREAGEHSNMLLAVTEDRQNRILMLEAKEDEQKKQMRSVIALVRELSRGFSELECQVAERVRNNNLRLEESSSGLSSLARKTSSLKNTALLYKKRLLRRCNDLQMAEAEVDLLGDEVDVLLSLLEKIYIALDHYSPILQHYPGVMETLKLVRRELCRESTKST